MNCLTRPLFAAFALLVLFLSPLSALAADSNTTSFLDPLFILGCLILIALVVVGVFAWHLHKNGVPNAALLDQVKLKAQDEGDMLLQRFFELLRQHSNVLGVAGGAAASTMLKLPSLQSRYFDAADFQMDVGFVVKSNPTFQSSVYLDDALVVAGKGGDDVRYYSADGKGGGNVSTAKPVPAATPPAA